MIQINRDRFVGGYRLTGMEKTREIQSQKSQNETAITVTPEDKKQDEPVVVEDVKVTQTATSGTENIVVPDTQGGIVVVRPDRQVFRKKILDFTEEYSRVLAVTFGVSAFLFNLGSTTVLNRRSMIWAGVAVVVVVLAFLVWHDRNKLFLNEKQLA